MFSLYLGGAIWPAGAMGFGAEPHGNVHGAWGMPTSWSGGHAARSSPTPAGWSVSRDAKLSVLATGTLGKPPRWRVGSLIWDRSASPMANTLIVGSQRLYVVTSEGHAAASAEASCECRWTLSMSMLVCEHCGTAVELDRPAFARREAKRG
jgi:hypothetical protein